MYEDIEDSSASLTTIIGGSMAYIHVQTEEVYRKQQNKYRCGCWGPCTCPTFIHADELVDVLNSASDVGSSNRNYVVMEEK